MLPDIEIARQTELLPIDDIAAKLGIGPEHLEHYGRVKAKISQDFCQHLETEPQSAQPLPQPQRAVLRRQPSRQRPERSPSAAGRRPPRARAPLPGSAVAQVA